MKIAIIFQRFGPYHISRLNAAAQVCELTSVELASADNTYAWDAVGDNALINRRLVFSNAPVNAHPISEIRETVGRVLTDANPQVVFVPGWSGKGAFAALEWCRNNKVPAIVMSESNARDEKRFWFHEWLKSKYVRQFAGGLAGGQMSADYLVQLGLARNKVYQGYDVVENEHFSHGADHARTERSELRKKFGLPQKFFLSSNRFIPKKNLSRLIDAYCQYQRQVGDEAWQLVLLGDGALRPDLEQQICDLGLEEWVLLPGFKQYPELPIYYGLASAYVHASTTEQWGLVVNEAMAAGLPVIVSNRCGCAPDLIENGRNGYTFDPYNINEMADLMCKISSDDCDRAAMGGASREIISRWTPETFARGFCQAVDAAMSAPKPHFTWIDRALLWALSHK